jgi:hypothetical protein
MIRPFTLLAFGVAAAAGLQMFQIKAGVTALEREIREANRQVEAARTRSEVLRAEWALLNEPSRLRNLVERHLELEPIRPQQFARISDLPQRAPQPIAFSGPVPLFPGARAAIPPAQATERTFADLALREAAAPPAAREPEPLQAPPNAAIAAQPAVFLPLPPPPPPGLVDPVPRLAAPPAELRLASAEGAPRRRIEAETLAPPPGARSAPRPAVSPSSEVVPQRPAPAAVARPGPAPAIIAAPAPAAGSMLGGVGSLPPPVPRGAPQ